MFDTFYGVGLTPWPAAAALAVGVAVWVVAELAEHPGTRAPGHPGTEDRAHAGLRPLDPSVRAGF